MNYPLQALIQLGVIPACHFPDRQPLLRYPRRCNTPRPTARTITYLARRFVPQPGAPNYATVAQHTVAQGDRLDLIAAKYLGDPLMFWLLCDANGAIVPNDLRRDARPRAGHHHAAGRSGQPVSNCFKASSSRLMIGPVVPLTVPRVVLDSLGRGRGHGRRRRPQRLSAHLQHRQAIAAADSLPAHRRPAAAVHARHSGRDRQRRRQRADRRRHHQQPDLPRRQGLQLHPHPHRQGPDRADGPVRLERLSLPGLPPEARVALLLAKYALFGVVPLVIPSIMIDHAPTHRADPRPAGHRPRLHPRCWPTQVGYVFYIDPGPVPGMSKAYWGPQIKVGAVAALAQRRHGRLHQCREPALQLRPGEEQDSDRLISTTRRPASAFRFPIPPITPLNPPLGADSAAADQHRCRPTCKPLRDDLAKLPDSAGAS